MNKAIKLTPPTIGRLEDLQGNLTAVLNKFVFAIGAAVTLGIALVDMVATIKIDLSETTSIPLTCSVWEMHIPEFIFIGLLQTMTRSVLTAATPPILCPTITATHKTLIGLLHIFANDTLVDEFER